MTSTAPFNPKTYYKKYYLDVSKINCICEDRYKPFATLQTLKRHQRTNQKCLIIKLQNQLKENQSMKKADLPSTHSVCSTTYDMSSPSDIDFEQEPELKSHSIFNYLI